MFLCRLLGVCVCVCVFIYVGVVCVCVCVCASRLEATGGRSDGLAEALCTLVFDPIGREVQDLQGAVALQNPRQNLCTVTSHLVTMETQESSSIIWHA